MNALRSFCKPLAFRLNSFVIRHSSNREPSCCVIPLGAKFDQTMKVNVMIAMNPRYQSAHNSAVSQRVQNLLIRMEPNRFHRISATAFYGIVELSGTVATHIDKMRAIQIAERIPGVTTVVESIRVQTVRDHHSPEPRLQPKIRRFSRITGRTARDGTTHGE